MRPFSSGIEPIAWLLAALLACPWELALAAGTARAVPTRRSVGRSAGPGLTRERPRSHRGRIEPSPLIDDFDDPDDPGDVRGPGVFAAAPRAGGRIAPAVGPLQGPGSLPDGTLPGFPVVPRLRC